MIVIIIISFQNIFTKYLSVKNQVMNNMLTFFNHRSTTLCIDIIIVKVIYKKHDNMIQMMIARCGEDIILLARTVMTLQ